MFVLGEKELDFFAKYPLPKFIDVRQEYPNPDITAKIPELLAAEFQKEYVKRTIKPGMKIAVAVSSRGLTGIAAIVKETVRQIKLLGASPFIIPAMGSHGGCDAEKQKLILQGMGITEETAGAPIRATMDVVELGQTDDGLTVYFNRLAFLESDGVIVINRVKPHTDFRAETESGLLKMITIGLGNAEGANQAHSFPMKEFGRIVPKIARVALDRGLVKLGIATVENAYKGIAHFEIIEPDHFFAREKELLAMAKGLLGRLLMEKIDLLVVRELGKDVSGSGIDNNAINRYIDSYMVEDTPRINKIAVLDLTKKTRGHAPGIGYADVITRRITDTMDYISTYRNCIIGRAPISCRIPLTVENDYLAIQCGLQFSESIENGEPRIVIIKNTAELHDIKVSARVWEDVKEHKNISAQSGFYDIEFNQYGNLC